jgi:hypothetical protein
MNMSPTHQKETSPGNVTRKPSDATPTTPYLNVSSPPMTETAAVEDKSETEKDELTTVKTESV